MIEDLLLSPDVKLNKILGSVFVKPFQKHIILLCYLGTFLLGAKMFIIDINSCWFDPLLFSFIFLSNKIDLNLKIDLKSILCDISIAAHAFL